MTEREWLNGLKTFVNNEIQAEGRRFGRLSRSDYEKGFRMGCNHTINELDTILMKIEHRLKEIGR